MGEIKLCFERFRVGPIPDTAMFEAEPGDACPGVTN